MIATDPVAVAQALIRCPSVTPAEGGALTLLESLLRPLGFECHRLPFNDPAGAPADNLFAHRDRSGPHLCFAGHTDVVPPGNRDRWSVDPFGGIVRDGLLIGRGACDMKGAVAAAVAAVARLAEPSATTAGSISLLITGDEEGDAVNGTAKMVDWLIARGDVPDACVVGEPTSIERLGDTVKNGRRGSLNARLTVFGREGHAAYPHLADNPLPKLVRRLNELANATLDDGTDHFPPSTLALTGIDTGNPASNVIPGQVTATFNIRFNDRHDAASLTAWLHQSCTMVDDLYALDVRRSAEAFVTPPGPLTEMVATTVQSQTGHRPTLGTGGGTSDARFLKALCPVVEVGLVGSTAHKADEAVPLADLETLTEIYRALFERAATGIGP